ncbi:hypothetical protein Acid345_3763 [Candidatus Koribacter versatilis Ellin345]|uniref:ParB-like N-terminal domain-containing protein n=1 Tax=Koribacter versatilis (strain Ellin345) TaxID=204669 RepID=Q1IK37_KORVE|nr:ParB/RepB/Spo0J family partition protein [Candidatus Koribacter versatilis]ABF42763.1 hypothetical protein Acid345_3763 [Candidatus Koribacter versatilis Ellin345]
MDNLQLSAIRLDFQPNENLDERTVLVYVEQVKRGEPLGPLVVRHDGESYFLQDGFHRAEAARRCGLATVRAEVSEGTLEQMEAEFRAFVQTIQKDLAR